MKYDEFIVNLSEKLIKDLDYIPLDYEENKYDNMIFKRMSGNKEKYIKVLHVDANYSLKSLNMTYKELESKTQAEFYLYLIVFSKKPDKEQIEEINIDFTNKRAENNKLGCVVVCLEDNRILLSMGIIFPNHTMVESIRASLTSFDNSKKINISMIIEEKNKKPVSQIMETVDEGLVLDSISAKLTLLLIIILGTLKAIGAWTGVFFGAIGGMSGFISNYFLILVEIAFFYVLSKIVEDNYGERKLFVLLIIGGLISFISVVFLIMFELTNQIQKENLLLTFLYQPIGGVLYMRFRIKNLFKLYKGTKYILGCIVLYTVVNMVFFQKYSDILIMVISVSIGFLVSGVLGFENEVVDGYIKKKMGVYLTGYILLYIISYTWLYLYFNH